MKTLFLAILASVLIVGCTNKSDNYYGEWVYYYAHGDSMVYQFDTAQMVIRKFIRVEVADGTDSAASFDQVYFYYKYGDTLYLDWARPTDTGVALYPSSYHLIRKITADSLILAAELGPDIQFIRKSDEWPTQSKAEMIDYYHHWLDRQITPPDLREE